MPPSHNRGRTLWELYSVRVYKLHSAFQLQSISADKFVLGLEGLLGMLAEVWISSYCRVNHYVREEIWLTCNFDVRFSLSLLYRVVHLVEDNLVLTLK